MQLTIIYDSHHQGRPAVGVGGVGQVAVPDVHAPDHPGGAARFHLRQYGDARLEPAIGRSGAPEI